MNHRSLALALIAVTVAVVAAPAARAHDAPGFQVDVRRTERTLSVRVAADARTWREAPGLAEWHSDERGAGSGMRGREAAWREACLRCIEIRDGRDVAVPLSPASGSSTASFESASLSLVWTAPDPGGEVTLSLSLFGGQATGEGLVRWSDALGSRVVRIELPGTVLLAPIVDGSGAEAPSFLLAGIRHILTGIDHIAFLFVLMVVGRSLRDVAQVATAFTISHSLTLGLSAFDLLHVPAAPVEAVIAASIVLAAASNLAGGSPHHRSLVAFGFGLVHGLGFSSGLAELLEGAPGARLAAVAAFNGGVELGQLAVVLLVAPPLLAWRRRSPQTYERVGLHGLSVLAGVAGLVWFAERTLLA